MTICACLTDSYDSTSDILSGRFATPFASMTKNMKIFTPSTLSPQHRARHRVRDGWNSGGWD